MILPFEEPAEYIVVYGLSEKESRLLRAAVDVFETILDADRPELVRARERIARAIARYMREAGA